MFNKKTLPEGETRKIKLQGLPLELLRWLSLNLNKRESVVDEKGVQTFGPFKYYTTMRELHGREQIYLMEWGKEAHYVIPREIDRELTMEFIGEKGEREEDTVYFCVEHFQLYLFLYLNSVIQNLEEQPLLRRFPVIHKWFWERAEELVKMDGKTLFHWLFHGGDDFIEHYVMDLFSSLSEKNRGHLAMTYWKEALYGCPIKKSEFNPFKEKGLGELMESPFVGKSVGFTLLDLEMKGETVQDAVPLHTTEWLFPIKANPFLLCSVMLFGNVESIGQMVHLQFSKETVNAGKKAHVASFTWEPFLEELFHYHGEDLQELWKEGKPIIKKQETFVFYEIRNKELLNHLIKEGNTKFANLVFPSEQGIFVKDSAVKNWERLLKDADLPVREESGSIKKAIHLKPSAKQRSFLPKEWGELNQLSSVSFQLMNYKENMAARIVRQSQAFQLPVIMEEKDGSIFAAEVKTLQFNGGQGEIETFHGNRIKLGDIKRLAIYHPSEEKYRINGFK
ncbi:MAG: hypothetical protein LRY73_04815 [Bacillus sp. (in: Bacteria)]|nr:hypothetical protein [Bacillus sp. (in: firmicutes)]